MTWLFSILLYPFFVLVILAVTETLTQDKNAALFAALIAGCLCSCAYYLFRREALRRSREKKAQTQTLRHRAGKLMMMKPEAFAALFPGENVIADNSYEGLGVDGLLDRLRRDGCEKTYEMYLLNGMTEGCRDLLALMGVSYREHPIEELVERAPESGPEVSAGTRSRRLKALFSSSFRSFALRYGTLLLLMSLFSPFRVFHLVFGGGLLLFAVATGIREKLNPRNQTPCLRS